MASAFSEAPFMNYLDCSTTGTASSSGSALRSGGDETAQRVSGKFIGRTFGGALVHNPGVDSTAVHAREKAAGEDRPGTAEPGDHYDRANGLRRSPMACNSRISSNTDSGSVSETKSSRRLKR